MITFEDSKHNLSHEYMDKYHQDFTTIYNSLENNSIGAYQNLMLKLIEQTKSHFSYEEEQMDKYNYPRIKEHKDEHTKVLSEMNYFLERSNSNFGAKLLQSYYLEKLPNWFDLHLSSMDSDLASFIKNQ
jgi:hemerythrin-like metal-binding protein